MPENHQTAVRRALAVIASPDSKELLAAASWFPSLFDVLLTHGFARPVAAALDDANANELPPLAFVLPDAVCVALPYVERGNPFNARIAADREASRELVEGIGAVSQAVWFLVSEELLVGPMGGRSLEDDIARLQNDRE